MTEVYFDLEFLLQSFVMDEEEIIIESQRLKLLESFLYPADGILHRSDGDRMYFLQERSSRLPVGTHEKVALTIMTRDDEVALGIPNSLSGLDIYGSFVNHALIPNLDFNLALAPSSSVDPAPVILNPSAIHAFDICANSHTGNIWQILVILLNALGNMLRRLIIHQILGDCGPEEHMSSNVVGPGPIVFLAHIALMLGIRSVVQAILAGLLGQLIRDCSLGQAHSTGNFCLRVSLAYQDVNLCPINLP